MRGTWFLENLNSVCGNPLSGGDSESKRKSSGRAPVQLSEQRRQEGCNLQRRHN